MLQYWNSLAFETSSFPLVVQELRAITGGQPPTAGVYMRDIQGVYRDHGEEYKAFTDITSLHGNSPPVLALLRGPGDLGSRS